MAKNHSVDANPTVEKYSGPEGSSDGNKSQFGSLPEKYQNRIVGNLLMCDQQYNNSDKTKTEKMVQLAKSLVEQAYEQYRKDYPDDT